MVHSGVWPLGWRSEECWWKWHQSGKCDFCEHSWSRVRFNSFCFVETAMLILLFVLCSHMVPFNQPEAALVCLVHCSTLPSNLLVLGSFLILCPCLFFVLFRWELHLRRPYSPSSNDPLHLFSAPLLMCFLFRRIWSLGGSRIFLCRLSRVRLRRRPSIPFLNFNGSSLYHRGFQYIFGTVLQRAYRR